MKLLKSGLLASLVFSTASLVSIQSPAEAWDPSRGDWNWNGKVELPSPPPIIPKGEYQTNKFDLKGQVEAGGWTTSWADDISETDAAQGVVAAGISVYTANSGPFMLWVEQLVQRTLYSISADLTGNARKEAERLARQVIYDAVSGKSAKEITRQFDTVDFKAGAIRYSGRNLFRQSY